MNKAKKIIVGALCGFALVGGIPAAGISAVMSSNIVNSSDYKTHSISESKVRIEDPHDVLSPEDEARMINDINRVEVVESIKEIIYIVFAHNRENVNDSVEEYMRANLPDRINNTTFKDGVLIVGVGLSPRQAFVFAGEDVADALDLRNDSKHLRDSVDAMKNGVIDNNIPAGLFASVNMANNVKSLEDSQKNTRNVMSLTSGAIGGLFGGMTGGGIVFLSEQNKEKRRRKIEKARKNKETILNEYTHLANNLDNIDIRANSLKSSYVDKTLRSEWGEVRDGFLKYNDIIHGANGIGTISDDNETALYSRSDELEEIINSISKVKIAESNINRLFKLEKGDLATRKKALKDMREDMLKARRERMLSDSLKDDIEHLITKVEKLFNNVENPKFMEYFTFVLDEYNQLIQHAQDEIAHNMDAPVRKDIRPMRIYERDYGYNRRYSYRPYIVVDHWRNDNVQMERMHREQERQRERSSSSSRTNSSFSSGFSGSGGSSSF